MVREDGVLVAGGLVVLTLLRYICTVIRVHERGRYGAFNVGLQVRWYMREAVEA